MPLDETIDVGQADHIADHEAIHVAINALSESVSQEDVDASIDTHNADVEAHDAVSGTSRVCLLHGGGRNIYVQNTAPTAENVGDVWIDTSA